MSFILVAVGSDAGFNLNAISCVMVRSVAVWSVAQVQ
jgi:hypothetical protein